MNNITISTNCQIFKKLTYNITNMKKIHMMGVSGSGMSGVASLASKMGYTVTGCDLKTGGHNKKHLNGIDLLIVSPAVLYQSKNEPELLIAKKKKIVMTWEEFVAKFLMKNKFVIAIAGTHGKSTTTAMIGKMMIDNGFDPTVLIGAKIPEWNGNSRYGKSKYFVIEADEFNDNFLHYKPEIAIVNNIEFDHPDYFKNKKQFKDSFDKFIKQLVGEKILISEKDSLNKKFKLKVFGKHNQKNANMAYLLGKRLGISDQKIIKSLENFNGIGRRMEEISDNIFDDYAHHPTAIKTTLQGLRKKYPTKKILAIIEPHGYKRTKALLNLYDGVFDSVDKVIIGPIYKARDEIDKTISSEMVAKASNHPNAKVTNDVANISKNNNDIVIFMGAGNSNQWALNFVNNNISFKDLTTLKIGGKIKYFFEVRNKKELVEKVGFAKKNKVAIIILGGGSDILAGDRNFNGVVIKYINNKLQIIGSNVIAGAGVIWDDLVKETVSKDLSGVERLSGIPGTVGAAPIQNIGAYGQELSDTFVSLTAYDIENRKFTKFNKDACHFGYRKSIFKDKKYWQKFIITDVVFKLNKNKNLDLNKIRQDILKIRDEKLENPKNIPNAGSFFINPFVNLKTKERLEKKYPDMKFYPVDDKFKIFAGFLIEKAGWKGKSLGPVKVSDKHALVITNPRGIGHFKDIIKLVEAITKDVYKKFGLKLEPEVQYINI